MTLFKTLEVAGEIFVNSQPPLLLPNNLEIASIASDKGVP
jgi:hypothetical protein